MHTKPHDALEKDDLTVGLTRPAMIMGVEKSVAFLNVMVGIVVCLQLQRFFPLLLFAFFHGIAMLKSRKEPLFLHLLWHRWLKTPPTFHFSYWGHTNSYLPH